MFYKTCTTAGAVYPPLAYIFYLSYVSYLSYLSYLSHPFGLIHLFYLLYLDYLIYLICLIYLIYIFLICFIDLNYLFYLIYPAGCGIARVGASPLSKNDNPFSVSWPSQSIFFFFKSFFLRLATLPHKIRTCFCLASFSDHCACRPVLFFFQQVRTQRVFPSPLPGSNVFNFIITVVKDSINRSMTTIIMIHSSKPVTGTPNIC